jgi:hypothetical protein
LSILIFEKIALCLYLLPTVIELIFLYLYCLCPWFLPCKAITVNKLVKRCGQRHIIIVGIFCLKRRYTLDIWTLHHRSVTTVHSFHSTYASTSSCRNKTLIISFSYLFQLLLNFGFGLRCLFLTYFRGRIHKIKWFKVQIGIRSVTYWLVIDYSHFIEICTNRSLQICTSLFRLLLNATTVI